jgi:hypothetical protein
MDHKHLKFLLMFGFHNALAFTDNAGRPQEIFKTLWNTMGNLFGGSTKTTTSGVYHGAELDPAGLP